MSPYLRHVINATGFVRDFGFQMRHVFEYGHGADLGSGWTYHPRVTLRYGVGVLVLFCCVCGLFVMGVRRSRSDWVLLSLFVAFFIVIGRGRVVFFRYALPLLPLLCVFCAVFIDRVRRLDVVPKGYVSVVGIVLLCLCVAEPLSASVRLNVVPLLCVFCAVDRVRRLDVVPKGYVSVVGIVLLCLCVAEPLSASVRLNVLLGREDTRTQARAWIEEHIPEGQLIANVGGLYGDVQIRNRHNVSWWLWRFNRVFPECDVLALATYLKQFEDDLPPHFAYHFLPGEKSEENGLLGHVNLLSNPELSIIITHEHPLHYSTVDTTFLSTLKNQADLWATFRPKENVDLSNATFDLQDAFYYPLAQFGTVERGGPTIKIWYLKDRPFSIYENPRDQTLLLRDSFFWMANTLSEQHATHEAITFYQHALTLDPSFTLAQTKLQLLKKMNPSH